MKELVINTTLGSSRICLEETIQNLVLYLNGNSTIITDSNVLKAQCTNFPELPIIEVEPGEASKDLTKVQKVYEKLLEKNLSRSDMLIGIGGGVVTDITGFVGATYKRGIKFGLVPTSLLAMVDASRVPEHSGERTE